MPSGVGASWNYVPQLGDSTYIPPPASIEQQQMMAQLQQLQAQLGSQQSIAGMNNANNLQLAGMNNANNLQLAGMNNASAQNIAGMNNASNNTMSGIAQSKYNQGLSLLGLLGGGQGGGQPAMNLGSRPATPSPLPTRGNISTQQVEAYNQQLSAQAQWDYQNSQQSQGGGQQLGGLGQAIAGGGGGMDSQMQQMLALGLIDPQLASSYSQQNIAGMNNANNLQVTGMNNQNALQLAGVNNGSQMQQLLAQLSGQNTNNLNLAGVNNASQQQIAEGGWQNQLANTGLQNSGQLANTGLQNQGNQQLAGINNQAQMQQLLANLSGQNSNNLGLAGVNNQAQMQQLQAQIASQQGIAQGGWQNDLALSAQNIGGQLANTGLQNQGQQQLAGINNQSAMQQLMAQIQSQQGIAGLQSATTLANTGLQNSGAMSLANVNNASDLEQLIRSLTSQENITGLNNQNALQVAGINTAPAMQQAQLAREAFSGRQNLLQQILGSSGGLGGIMGEATGPDPFAVAQSGSNVGDVSSGYLAQLMAGADDQFTAMPQELFQQQLNQILGNAGSALGGQLRSAQGAAGGAGMGANSAVSRALQGQYGNASNANTQNSLTNAFLGKYNTDFQRQQASAGYKTGIGQLGLGQTTQNQNYGLGLGNLQLGSLQNSTQRRGQNMGLIGQLTA